MIKYFGFAILSTCLFINGCSIGTKSSGQKSIDELVNSIDPFDFGDEFLQGGEISDASENSSLNINSDAVINSNENLPDNKNEQELLNSETITNTVGKFGYRIQIGAFEFEANADELKRSAGSKTDLPIYVVYIAPFYRVRIGDFIEKNDADEYVKIFKDKGFKDARWVHTNINSSQK